MNNVADEVRNIGEQSHTTGYRIGLVSCVKSKQCQPELARYLYSSALFHKARAWAEARCDCWFILSAKYGLVLPDTVIEPYELTLKGMAQSERILWARRVHTQLEEVGVLEPRNRLIWLAGAAYKQELSRLLSGFQQEDPMLGMAIGHRLQWLTKELANAA